MLFTSKFLNAKLEKRLIDKVAESARRYVESYFTCAKLQYMGAASCSDYILENLYKKDRLQICYKYFEVFSYGFNEKDVKKAVIMQAIILMGLESALFTNQKGYDWNKCNCFQNIKTIMEGKHKNLIRGVLDSDVGSFALKILFTITVCMNIRSLKKQAELGCVKNFTKKLNHIFDGTEHLSKIETRFTYKDLSNPCFKIIKQELKLLSKVVKKDLSDLISESKLLSSLTNRFQDDETATNSFTCNSTFK